MAADITTGPQDKIASPIAGPALGGMMRRVTFATAPMIGAGPAIAQPYPSRPITMILRFTAAVDQAIHASAAVGE